MQRKKSPKKTLVVLGIVILGLFVGFYFVFMDIKHKNEHISVLSQSLSSDVNRQEFLAILRKNISSADLDLKRVNESIIPSDGDVKFIEHLESLAKKNNLTIDIRSLVFDGVPPVASSTVTTFKISAEIAGSWSGVYKFLVEMESQPVKIKMNSFSMASTEGEVPFDSKSTSKSGNEWKSTFEIVALKYK